MKTRLPKMFVVTLLSILLSVISIKAYSQSVKLEYKYSPDRSIKYISSTKIVQDMDVNGQSMLVNIARYMGCEIRGAGKAGQNVKVDVKIDSLFQNVESPQGSTGGTINEVKGKTFSIVISPTGKLIDNTDGSKIVYNVEGSGETNIGQEFLNYFPELPVTGVKPGDTWTTRDTINNTTATNKLWMPLESTYKFEGMEKVDGADCAKITATLTGSRKMVTHSQGMEIHMTGPFTGIQTLLFNVKDGYFEKVTISTKMNGNIEIPDQGMSFTVVMNVDATTERGKK